MAAHKSPTDILREEHETVLEILGRLEKDLKEGNAKSLEKNILVLGKEFNKHSLNKEEKFLFPELEKHMPREGGPTGMMIMEHEDLAGSIKEFKEALKLRNFKKLDELGNHILALLREHIDKENNILFMIADMHLDDKQKKAILDKFKGLD